jgi:outer membrane usher protein FimD/PapC
MGLTYRHSERTALSASASYTQYDYKTESDAKGQNYTFGVTYALTPTLTVGFTGGLTVTKIEDTDDSETDYLGGVNITKRFERGEASLAYNQSIINGIQSQSPVKSQMVSLSLSRPLSNKLTASLSTSYGKYKSVETSETDTDEITFTTSLTYSFRPWANLALSYSYVNSNDKIDDVKDYYNNRVFLTLNVSYGREARK